MISKILDKIDQAIRAEEEGILIYAKHLSNTLFWSGLDSGLKNDLKLLLTTLAFESEKHKTLLLEAKKRLISGHVNV